MSLNNLVFWVIPLLLWLAIYPVRSSSHKLQDQAREVLDAQARCDFVERFRGLLLKITPLSRQQSLKLSLKNSVPQIPDSFEECRNVLHFHLIPRAKERIRSSKSVFPIQIAGFIIMILMMMTRLTTHAMYFSAANLLLVLIACLFGFHGFSKAVMETNVQEGLLLKKVDEKATGFLTEEVSKNVGS